MNTKVGLTFRTHNHHCYNRFPLHVLLRPVPSNQPCMKILLQLTLKLGAQCVQSFPILDQL